MTKSMSFGSISALDRAFFAAPIASSKLPWPSDTSRWAKIPVNLTKSSERGKSLVDAKDVVSTFLSGKNPAKDSICE